MLANRDKLHLQHLVDTLIQRDLQKCFLAPIKTHPHAQILGQGLKPCLDCDYIEVQSWEEQSTFSFNSRFLICQCLNNKFVVTTNNFNQTNNLG